MKLLIFDLDGTLLDTLQDLADSCNAVLQTLGYPTHPPAAYRKFVGNGVVRLIERALPQGERSAATIEKVLHDFKTTYEERGDRHTRPYEGVTDMLREARAAGWLCSIASNKYDEAVIPLVKTHFPETAFDLILGHREGHPPKPDPDIVFDTLRQLQVITDDCCYIGDSDVDMQTATAAGVFPIGVTWGFRDEAELRQSGARLIVQHPSEIVPACNSLTT